MAEGAVATANPACLGLTLPGADPPWSGRGSCSSAGEQGSLPDPLLAPGGPGL